ncbi:MAG: hypothetical protein ACRDFQ_03520 [Anaerolineales bacterium]
MQPAPPDTTQIAAVIIQTLTAEAATETAARVQILPHPVFFLSARGGNAQIWRLEQDGQTLTQVTHETEPISALDVSRVDGSVAYISANQLAIHSVDGSEQLLVDQSDVNPTDNDYAARDRVSDPLFSPDGRVLAYGLNGIWLLDLDSGEASQLLENRNDQEKELYFPLAWSPDGQKLLISISSQESVLLGVLVPGEGPDLLRFEPEGLICCHISWSTDSQSVLVASPYLGLTEAGLWRYDASTGKGTRLIGENELYEFVGWPLELSNGDLQFFYSSSADIPQGEPPLYAMRAAADGISGRIQIREDALNISEALWAEDGSLALIVQSVPDGGGSGPLVLVHGDGRQLQVLVDTASHLHWAGWFQ